VQEQQGKSFGNNWFVQKGKVKANHFLSKRKTKNDKSIVLEV
jgi:hypothetical protein